MKLHIPDDFQLEADQLRTGAETTAGVLRLALQRGLLTLKQERAVPGWTDCGSEVYRWEHHQWGPGVTVELCRAEGLSWVLKVTGLGEPHSEILAPLPSGSPPFGPALYALQRLVQTVLLHAIGVGAAP